jgi:hypothetical protein
MLPSQSVQSEEGKNRDDDHDEAHEIDNSVHRFLLQWAACFGPVDAIPTQLRHRGSTIVIGVWLDELAQESASHRGLLAERNRKNRSTA